MMFVLTLPVPPSLNAKYISRRFIVSAEWRRYKSYASWCAYDAGLRKPLDGDLAINMTWFRAQRKGDIDSKLKCLLDALEGTAYGSDAQIKKLSISIVDEKPQKNPRIELMLATLEGSAHD
jgi:Holliday junction resolvase RusA-like endonuclease